METEHIWSALAGHMNKALKHTTRKRPTYRDSGRKVADGLNLTQQTGRKAGWLGWNEALIPPWPYVPPMDTGSWAEGHKEMGTILNSEGEEEGV